MRERDKPSKLQLIPFVGAVIADRANKRGESSYIDSELMKSIEGKKVMTAYIGYQVVSTFLSSVFFLTPMINAVCWQLTYR